MNNLPESVRSIVDDLNDLKDPILASAGYSGKTAHPSRRDGMPSRFKRHN